MSYDNFEQAIITWLYAVGSIPKNMDVIDTDFGIELNDKGEVVFDVTLAPIGQYQLPLGV